MEIETAHAPRKLDVAHESSISRLPAELKAHILYFASLHDQEHRDRWEKGQRGADLAATVVGKWDGRALFALSQVSREFNQLSHPYIFKDLDSPQLSPAIFASTIAPKFGSHFRHLRMTSSACALNASAALILLPSLTRLTLSASAAVILFGPNMLSSLPPVDDSDADDHEYPDPSTPSFLLGRVVFKQGVKHISELSLEGFPPHGLAELAECFPTLGILKFTSSTFSSSQELAEVISRITRNAPTLEHLELCNSSTAIRWGPAMNSTPNQYLQLDAVWSAQVWSPNIKVLRLSNFALSANLLKFVSTFATSLHALHLSFGKQKRNALPMEDFLPSPCPPFPLLRALSLSSVDPTHAIEIIKSFAHPSASLADISLAFTKSAHGGQQALSASLQLHQRTLRRARIVHSGVGTGGPSLSGLRTYLPTVEFIGRQQPDPFFFRGGLGPLDDEGKAKVISRWAAALDATLTDIQSRLDHYRETGDLAGVEQMFELLLKCRVQHLMAAPSV